MKMQSLRRIGVVATLVLATNVALAHKGGHHDELALDPDGVAQLADASVAQLVKSQKLAAVWAKGQRQGASLRADSKPPIWVVTYKNPSASQGADAMLYVFFDELGNFLEANHTGKRTGK
jgi:hypothetical protein